MRKRSTLPLRAWAGTALGVALAHGAMAQATAADRVAAALAGARDSRRSGDLVTAERRCQEAFAGIEDAVVDAYGRFADGLQATGAPNAGDVRAQAARLAELRAQRAAATAPTSTYLGFLPEDGLNAYARWLESAGRADEARNMRSLAVAYRASQGAQVQRTMMFQRGQDPRGVC